MNFHINHEKLSRGGVVTIYENIIPVVVDENGKTTNFENLGRELRDGEMIRILRR